MDKLPEPFKLIGHSYQIADTGDYDGCYEITNGKISIFTKDDEEENLEPVVKALNDCGSDFYLDDSLQFENHLLTEEVKRLKELPVKFSEWLSKEQLLIINTGMIRVFREKEIFDHWYNTIYLYT